MRERGSALLTAVISVTVLLLISGIFFSLVNDQMKSNSYEEKAIKSYYLAQAGVFYGIAKIRVDNVPTSVAGEIKQDVPNPFGYGGRFRVIWEKSVDELYLYYTITGTGWYGSGTGEVQRSLKAFYKVSATGGATGGGEEIVGQTVLDQEANGHPVLGQGNTMFVFSNSPTPVSPWPVVKLYQPIYIYTVFNDDHIRAGNSLASNVRISLRSFDLSINYPMTILDSDGHTLESVYSYTVPDFQGVSAPFTITYGGTESVKLVIEGLITTGNNDPANWGTGTVNTSFLVSSDSGLIWQVEQ